jgi:hypothetical protein
LEETDFRLLPANLSPEQVNVVDQYKRMLYSGNGALTLAGFDNETCGFYFDDFDRILLTNADLEVSDVEYELLVAVRWCSVLFGRKIEASEINNLSETNYFGGINIAEMLFYKMQSLDSKGL